MDQDLKDKIVVITGGASGIGYEIADKFLQNEAKVVVILDINENQGPEAVNTLNSKHGNGKSVFIKCDVTSDLDAVSHKIINDYEHVDVLVNNAGLYDTSKRTIDLNVTALIEWSLKFWNHMRKDQGGNGGTIINLASIYGYRVSPYIPVYHASKFTVMGKDIYFSRTLGQKYNFDRTGVRVVAITPGYTKASLAAICNTFEASNEKFMKDLAKLMEEQTFQEACVVGQAAVDVFKRAESGTAWLIEESKPVEQNNTVID